MGKCCNGQQGSRNECNEPCQPRFRVCLKEYQVKIDTTSPCTFGDVITSVRGSNAENDSSQDGFHNPIRMPFQFSWPVSYFN